MKKFILVLAAVGSLSGVALAERPVESSDRTDYITVPAVTSQAADQSQYLAVDGAIDAQDQRRLDEKNEVSN